MNETNLAKNRVKKHRIGVKGKIFVILVIFLGCVLLSTWIVQLQMLNFFYQNAKFYELEESAEVIAGALEDEVEAKNRALYYAEDYYLDIWILEIAGERANWLIKADGSGNTFLPFLSQKLEALYSQAVDNGGIYIATVRADDFVNGVSIEVLEDNSGNSSVFPEITKYKDTISAIYVKLVEVNGRRYMIVQHSTITPLRATVSTLKYQFAFVGMGMIFMALLLAIITSKFITKPFVKMNEAAKKLARGDYSADFTGQGYREIDELAMTLNYASHELAKTDNLQKELISNVSHDLRTPLTMIKGYSEVMRDIPGENTPENIQVIIDETTRLSELVNDMLDLSKIQSGTRKPNFEKFSITDTVSDTLKRYEKLIMQDGYKIDFDVDENVSVVADRGMILQVIYNLINNAINYTGEDKYVRVEQKNTKTHVRISVSDTGEGIAKEDMTNIWERYYRVDKVHKRATIGTGLGLSIVKGVLEAHGAAFGVESVYGHGATFWFELEIASMPDVIDAQYEKNFDGEI